MVRTCVGACILMRKALHQQRVRLVLLMCDSGSVELQTNFPPFAHLAFFLSLLAMLLFVPERVLGTCTTQSVKCAYQRLGCTLLIVFPPTLTMTLTLALSPTERLKAEHMACAIKA